jgi:O-antigen/teichoic acid export membrane protein
MMLNKEQQLKNSVLYLLPVVIGSLLPVFVLPIFTRILSKEDYGVLALANVYAIFVNGFANFGMTEAYKRNYFEYRDNSLKTGQLLYSTLMFVILNFLFLATLTFFFKGRISELIMGSSAHGAILFWAFCAQFFNGISYYYLSYFRNSENAKNFVAYTIAATMLNIGIAFFLVVFLRIGVIGLVFSQLFSGAIVFGMLSYKFVRSISPYLSLSKPILYESLKLSYPLTPRVFLGVISSQFDKYMIGLLASIGGVGIYSIGQRVATMVFTFMTAISNVYQPQVLKRMFAQGADGGKVIGQYLTPFAYISVSVAIMMALFSEEIITILTPQSYHGAVDIVTVLSMYYGFLFFGTQSQLLFAKKTHLVSLLSVSSIGFNVLLNIPFIMKWGAIGAAWATFLASLISGSISLAVSQHYYKIKWEYGKLMSVYFVFFGTAILTFLLRHLEIPYEYRAILKSICAVSYLYLGVRLKVITLENLGIVKNMILSKWVIPADDAT